ncbi:MAG TPA: DUF2891 family protein, partial [Gemmataceae bacterium]|nr:DUF2891 family protein [Gemmataceae bacterium]
DLVLNLNEPCALADTSWIHPGKTTFPWWNGYHPEGVPFKAGLNTATMKHYIDFCAEAGIPYHSLDGLDNVAWYGGPIVPYKGADIVQGMPGLDLAAVIRYARRKGVRLRLWMHWQAARDHMDRAFPLYRKWGIEGVMIDFMDRDDQEMVNWQRKLLRLAAANHLTVTLHGVAKPTGLDRTYPNLLTSEGVLNLEYDKWDPLGCSPEHMLTVPFTRMLAGPLDFHQGSFRGVPVGKFRPRNEAPLVMGTPCFALATYVVYQNHLPMVADYPAAYRGHPALKMLVQVPTTWDDTRAVAGSVGEYAVLARRHGADWYIGAMNAGPARSLRTPLTFLGPGRYRAESYADDAAAPYRLSRRTEVVTAETVLEPRLERDGGYFVWLTPLAEKRPGEAKEVSTMKPEQASAFARLALKGLSREYPNKPGDVLNDKADLWPVRVRHPAFYGSFDWHSSVHGHWMLVRLLRRFPHLPENKEIRSLLAAHLTAQNLQQEMDSFIRPNAQSFERPYGWAWLLKLAEELHGWDDPDGREWSKNLKPLADVIVARYLAFFPKQTQPIRSGVHPNTAFGLTFAFDYARAVGDKRLQELIVERSLTYFVRDAGIPAAWEPDGADFLSPSLAEADLMRRILPPGVFPTWFHRFLPDVAKGEPRTLLTPAKVTDRRDPQLVHLDGLNLSRAWCMRGIAAALPKDDPARKVLAEAATHHAEAALPHVASGDYVGEHWLASFAVYLLSAPLPD